MSGSLSDLCAWAATLSAADIPPDVATISRLQHLALAGAARRLAALPGGDEFGGGAAAHTARFLQVPFDDLTVGGRVGAGLGPAAWLAEGGTLDELVTSSVAAQEVAARVGLAGSVTCRADEVDLRAMRVAAAVVRARAARTGAGGMLQEVEGALAEGSRLALAEVATRTGARRHAEAVHRSGSGAGAVTVASGALGAAGAAWLTRTLIVPRYPGSPWMNTALDALDVVLCRHLKAGEKRLRADQIERVVFRTAWGSAEAAAAALPRPALGATSLAEAAALMITHHELGPEWLTERASGDKTDDVAAVAARVEVVTDSRLSARKLRLLAEALGPVLGETGLRVIGKAAAERLRGAERPGELLPLLRERPWAALAGLRRRGGLATCTVDDALSWPTELKLYTTRGGWWPERRQAPTGHGAGLEPAARARFADDARADRLMSSPGDRLARDWIAELLS